MLINHTLQTLQERAVSSREDRMSRVGQVIMVILVLLVSLGFFHTSAHAQISDRAEVVGTMNASSSVFQENIYFDPVSGTSSIPNDHQVYVDFVDGATTHALSGYAWSPTLGEITFDENELTGCPSEPCEAYLDEETNTVGGWAKVADSIGWNVPHFGGLMRDLTFGPETSAVYAHQAIEVYGQYAYLGGSNTGAGGTQKSSFFTIYNISNPESPQFVSHIDLKIAGAFCALGGDGCDITNIRYAEWNGHDLLFVSAFKFGWFAFDLADPTNPTLLAWANCFAGCGVAVGEVWETAVFGDRAYITGQFAGTYRVGWVNLNDLYTAPPANVTLNFTEGAFAGFTGSDLWQDLAVYNNYMIVAGRGDGVKVYNMGDPGSPTPVLVQTFTDNFSPSFNAAYGLYVYGDTLYVTKLDWNVGNPAGASVSELMVIPLINGNVQPMSTGSLSRVRIDTPDRPARTNARAVTVATEGNGKTYAFVAADVGGLIIFDVTDSSNIRQVVQMVHPTVNGTARGQSFEVVYQNGVAYVGVDKGPNISVQGYPVIKAGTGDDWINLSQDQYVNSPSLSYDPNTSEISGEADGGDLLGRVKMGTHSVTTPLYVSRKPVVTLSNEVIISPYSEVSWSVSSYATVCVETGGDPTWPTLWDVIGPVANYSGTVSVGPVISDTIVGLTCQNRLGKSGSAETTISVPVSTADLIVTDPLNTTNADKSITFTGTLKNDGTSETNMGQLIWGDLEIDWNRGNCSAATSNEEFSAGGSWERLQAGDPKALSATLTFDQLQSHPGNHCYRLVADRTNLVTETSDENNSSTWESFNVVIPSGYIVANPMFVFPGQTSSISWASEDATTCEVTSNQNADQWTDLNHSGQTTAPLNDDTTYILACDDVVPVDYITVHVGTQDLSITPRVVNVGSEAVIGYNTNGQPDCVLTGGSLNQPVVDSGSVVVTPINGKTTFTLSCGLGSESTTVEILPSIFES